MKSGNYLPHMRYFYNFFQNKKYSENVQLFILFSVMKRYRSDEEEPYYRNLVVRNIPTQIPDGDVIDCLYQEYRKYGKCKVELPH